MNDKLGAVRNARAASLMWRTVPASILGVTGALCVWLAVRLLSDLSVTAPWKRLPTSVPGTALLCAGLADIFLAWRLIWRFGSRPSWSSTSLVVGLIAFLCSSMLFAYRLPRSYWLNWPPQNNVQDLSEAIGQAMVMLGVLSCAVVVPAFAFNFRLRLVAGHSPRSSQRPVG